METARLDRAFGREAFGADPVNYHAARPAYPEETWAALRKRAGLAPGIDILEIGAGTGIATKRLLAHRPASLLAIEPDARLADFLQNTIDDPHLNVLTTSFEATALSAGAFDLVASATAFHWIEALPALTEIHTLLRPGGAVALWWNVFGGASRPDPFHEATQHLFAGTKSSPSSGGGKPEHALDSEARLHEFEQAGFVPDDPQYIRWTLPLDPAGVRGLYATYSNVNALEAAQRGNLLDGLQRIAADQFGGCVERNMTTAIYTAKRAL